MSLCNAQLDSIITLLMVLFLINDYQNKAKEFQPRNTICTQSEYIYLIELLELALFISSSRTFCVHHIFLELLVKPFLYTSTENFVIVFFS